MWGLNHGRVKTLERRLESLETTLATLTRSFQSLELEWVNAYGKFRKIAARINHDQAVIDSRQADTAEEAAVSPTQGRNGGLLTPRQREVQNAILRRRGGTA